MIENELIKEVAGEKNSHYKSKKKSKIKTCSVQFNRKVIWIGINLHG